MSMDQVKALMQEVGWGDLATTDGEKVSVRPMGGWGWFGSELWCATFEASEKIEQLKQVPYGAYCICAGDGRHVRISGPCMVSSDNEDKRKLYDANEAIKNHISDPAAAEYVVIRMKPERIQLMTSFEKGYEEVELED